VLAGGAEVTENQGLLGGLEVVLSPPVHAELIADKAEDRQHYRGEEEPNGQGMGSHGRPSRF